MQHLDEGTVHAWLDGELSETESVAATRHLDECAECAALVAEARGVIAGAARVVASLDAGPSGVIPKSRKAEGTGIGLWQRFARSPSRMAMAATILVAVGVTLTVRGAARDGTAKRSSMDEVPAAANAPVAQPSPAPSAPPVSAQVASPTAELKDRAPRTTSNEPSPAESRQAPVGDMAGFSPRAAKQPAPTNAAVVGAAGNALADKKKDADGRRDQPEAAKTLVEARPRIEPAPSPAALRADSVNSRPVLAKVADSVATQTAPTVRRLEAVAGAGPMREAAAQSRDARAAAFDSISGASLQGCYRLGVDTSAWRGVLPASFVLAGPPSRSQPAAVAGGQVAAPQKATAQSNAVENFSTRPNPAGYRVHGIGANGQADSIAIGDWATVGPRTARVRFATADQGGPVTMLISTASPFARVTAADRTDSLRITRVVCPR